MTGGSLRVLIVDDERLARRRIRKLLEEAPDVTVVGESADGGSAVEALREHRPDVVFLDVQMPGLDGFEVLAALGVDGDLPIVVFTTAYDTYALRAFEVHALDYLLKPFDDDRFRQALERARSQARGRDAGDLDGKLRELLSRHRPAGDRIVVKSGGRITFLGIDEIDWVEAEGSYVSLHAGDRSHLLRETMQRMESRLPAGRFLRIHRSTIVNLERIREVQDRHGECRVILEDGQRLNVSQSHRDRLRRTLGI